jgi:hypothetical protein
MGLGVAQLQQKKFAEAEGTLTGARNLLPGNAFPSLHLAKVHAGQGKRAEERAAIEHAISADPTSIDAWAVLFVHVRDAEGEGAAEQAVLDLADAATNKKSAAPFIAVQGVYAANEDMRDKAMVWAQKAVARDENDALALVSYTALLGQSGRLDEIIQLLAKHEPKMSQDVRLANNYFEALFHKRDLAGVTRLLNGLGASSNREVKQFAIERSRAVGQFLQAQQAQQAQAPRAASGLVGPSGRPLGQ